MPVALVVLLLAAALWPASAFGVTQPSFGPQREIATMTPGGTALDLTSGDLTGDGLEDVLVLRGRYGSTDDLPISIFVNNGRGRFRERTAELFEGPVPVAEWPRQALIDDFNGDARPDIFIGDTGLDLPPYPGYLNHLALSTGSGKLVDASANLPGDVRYFHSAAAGDVDADGDKDIFLADLGTPIRLLLNDGSGRFTTASGRLPPDWGVFFHPRFTRSEFVDVNGDLAVDLVLLAENTTPTSEVLLNDGQGYFTQLPNALPPKPFGADAIGTEVQVVQLNGDGIPDLLLGYTKSNYRGKWIQFAVGNGDGTFRDETATRLPQADSNLEWPYEIVLGDLNRDGAFDFAVDIGAPFCCPNRKEAPPFYLNRGDGTFEPAAPTAFAEPSFGQLRMIDANRDGDLDVFSVWQAGIDRPENYAIQLQNDDDGDGITNAADRCPRLAGTARNGCPGARLRRAGAVRVVKAGRSGVALQVGVRASCPAAGYACRGRVAVKSKHLRRSARLAIRSGRTASISIRLSRRNVRAAKKARRINVRISVALTGPDRKRLQLSRRATIRRGR